MRDGLLDTLDDGGECLVELLPCIFCFLLYPFHPISNILKAFNLTARSLLNRFVYTLLVKLNSRFMGLVYVSSETCERYALSLSRAVPVWHGRARGNLLFPQYILFAVHCRTHTTKYRATTSFALQSFSVVFAMMYRVLDCDCCITVVRTPSIFSPCRIRNPVSFSFHVVHSEATAFGRQTPQRSTLSIDTHNVDFFGDFSAISHVVGNHGSLAKAFHVHAGTLRRASIT